MRAKQIQKYRKLYYTENGYVWRKKCFSIIPDYNHLHASLDCTGTDNQRIDYHFVKIIFYFCFSCNNNDIKLHKLVMWRFTPRETFSKSEICFFFCLWSGGSWSRVQTAGVVSPSSRHGQSPVRKCIITHKLPDNISVRPGVLSEIELNYVHYLKKFWYNFKVFFWDGIILLFPS